MAITKKQKKQRGRPKLAEIREHRIQLRISDSELAKIRAAAVASGVPLADWIRARAGLSTTDYGARAGG